LHLAAVARCLLLHHFDLLIEHLAGKQVDCYVQPVMLFAFDNEIVRRGVVPVKFTLTQGGVATCALPPATIAVTRTAGGMTGEINESVYTMPADSGSNFRIDGCQYIYNLNSGALGVGTYRIDIKINNQVVGSAIFELR
jgi:hypothetical protein